PARVSGRASLCRQGLTRRLLLLQRLAEDVAQRCTRIRRTVLLDGLLLFGDLTCLDREVRLLRTVEADDQRVDLLAHLEAVRTLLVAVAAEVGPLDEARRTVVAGLNFEAAIADFEHGYRDHVVLLQPARAGAAGRRSALFELLHAQADTLLFDIDIENDRVDLLTLAVQRQRVLARNAPSDVRHVNHAVHVARKADKQAEFGGVLDFALDDRAHRVLVRELFPRIALGLLEAEADAALLGIDLEHHHFDFLRGRYDLARVDVLLRPAHFGDVDQAFDAGFQLHEGAVFGDVGDGAGDLSAGGA